MIGNLARSELPDDHWEALAAGVDITTDELFDAYAVADDASRRGAPFDFDDTAARDMLPAAFSHHYDVGFLRRFLICLIVVGWKLRQDRIYMLACVAEELALWAIIRRAGGWLDQHDTTADFSTLREFAFEDEDFLYLFDRSMDGFAESEEADRFGVANLRFSDWFTPFGDAQGGVHPYVEADTG